MHAGLLKPVQPQQLSVAARNAEALFEAKTVGEIRQIEARTQQDIEEKNLQLRQLVGDSYRDLIDGTDIIIDISTKCHSILDSILAIQEGCSNLAVSVSSTPGSAGPGKESVRKHRELNAVGSRVKYVMDTPEVIWGCLDAGSHLEAARRLLRVQEVQQQLQASYAHVVASKFPVLSHQWQIVLKFRQHILSGSLSALSSQQSLSSRAAADALAAVALLEGADSASALRTFLSARHQWVAQQLEQAAQGQAGEQPGEVLAALAQTVQDCIAQVGQLFTAQQQQPDAASGATVTTNSSSSLLQQVLQEDEADVSELYFGSAEGPAAGSSSPEAVNWRQRSEAFATQLAPLQQSQVQSACTAWLSDVAKACSKDGVSLLQQCTDADSLLQAQAAVHTAMAEWVAAPADATTDVDNASAAAGGSRPATAGSAGRADSSTKGSDSQLSRLGRLAPAVAAAAGTPAASPPGSPSIRGCARVVGEWEVTCLAVLGHKVNLWQVLFHEPFLERCKQLIAASLSEACSSIQTPLAAALQAAAAHDPGAAGHLQPGSWPSVATGTAADAAAAAAAAGVLERAGSLWASVGALSPKYSGVMRAMSLHPSGPLQDDLGTTGFRNEVQGILQLFDSKLHAALTAVLLLTAAPPTGGQQQHQGSGLSRAGSLHPTSSNPSILHAASLPAAGQPTAAGAGAGAAAAAAQSPAAAAAMAAAGKQRATELEAFAQQSCLQEVQQLAARLQRQLQQLPAASPGPQGAASIEQVLLLARLCSALGSQSCMLPAVLGPADSWAAAAAAGPHAGPPRSGGSAGTHGSGLPASLAQGVGALGPAAAALLRMHHPGLAAAQGPGVSGSGTAALLSSLQQQLHGIACSGYALWSAWVSSSFAAEVCAALTADELLYSDTTPLAWTVTKLSTDAAAGDAPDAASAGLLDLLDDAEAAAGDMSFALPACPSAPVLQALSRACWEVRRAGEHTIAADALQLLIWELHGALLAALHQLVQRSADSSSGVSASNGSSRPGSAAAGSRPKPLSEQGILQLLFDQRVLRDVLGGGKPLSAVSSLAAGQAPGGSGAPTAAAAAASPAGDAGAELVSRRRLASGLEQQLQDLLDPIDWATYEPHLWSNAQRFYTRTAVLLGVLGQLSRPYGDAQRAAAGAAAAEINALNVLPVVPRFHYLPISTPSTATLPKQRSMHLSMHASAAVSAMSQAAGAAAAAQPGGAGQVQLQLPLATMSAQASDLAAQYMFADLGSSSKSSAADSSYAAGGAAAAAAAAAASFLHPTADSAAAAGASALSALQAKLQGSSFSAFGSMLGDRAAEVTAMAQNFGDMLPSSGGLGGLGGGLLSSFARRDGAGAGYGGH